MSANDSAVTGRAASLRNLIPFTRGPDPRRSTSPLSPAEREFRKALDSEFVQEACAVLREMLEASRNAEVDDMTRQKARMDFMKCTGLIPKSSDGPAIQAVAKELLRGMLEEARAQRANERTP